MYYVTKTNSKGATPYIKWLKKYKDPLTGKWKSVTVSYTKNTSRGEETS